LVEEDSVFSKLYGKTTIYSVKQVVKEVGSAEDLEEISKSISDLNEKNEILFSKNRKSDQSKLCNMCIHF
jgi:hypothetical protein